MMMTIITSTSDLLKDSVVVSKQYLCKHPLTQEDMQLDNSIMPTIHLSTGPDDDHLMVMLPTPAYDDG